MAKSSDSYHSETLAIIALLEQTTGLHWEQPPEVPSLLKNGYHAATSMVRAPHIVRQLQQAAIAATGRPRAILFEATGRGNAIINLPREVAEYHRFTDHIQTEPYEAPSTRMVLPVIIPHPNLQLQ